MPFLTGSGRSRVTRGLLPIQRMPAPDTSMAEPSSPQRSSRRVMAIYSRWRLRAGQAGVRFPAAKSLRSSDNETMANALELSKMDHKIQPEPAGAITQRPSTAVGLPELVSAEENPFK